MEGIITIYSYYSPEELTGIGKYNGELLHWLGKHSTEILSITNVPFYPYWKKYKGYQNKIYQSSQRNNIYTKRSWVYIPSNPSSITKILSELSFLVSSILSICVNWRRFRHSELIIVVLPPFFLGIIPILFKKRSSKVLFHVQDLQIDAAKELNLLPSWLCNSLQKFERFQFNQADFISTISDGMRAKIIAKGINKGVVLMPNWTNMKEIKPIPNRFWLHKKLGIDPEKKLIVYSGNLGEKQGLEIILEASKRLENNKELMFVILGEGLYKKNLSSKSVKSGVKNLIFGSLVPKEKLNLMLNSSFIQLIIQKHEGADSFMPSKLTNILAAGCASIITANKGTGLYNLVFHNNTGKVIDSNSPDKLVEAILNLIKNHGEYSLIQKNARNWAENNLSIDKCLEPIKQILKSS